MTRSIIEYSSIIYPCLSKTNWCLLESIQKKSLKIVLKLPRDTSNKIYEEKIINIENLKLRLDKLNEKYLQNCITNENEIIIDLLKNYLNFSNARCLKYKTLFCNYVKFKKTYIIFFKKTKTKKNFKFILVNILFHVNNLIFFTIFIIMIRFTLFWLT